ncbi:MAG: hypothetical protein JHC54_05765 [Acinetobacter sp.]|nr:hypothetical protein [Acinetobacter sp.]
MKLADLIEVGKELAITYQEEKKAVFIEIVLAAFAAQSSTRMAGDIDLTPEMTGILENTEISKSEKMRQLHILGMSTAQISRETGGHYSFCHTIITKFKGQQAVAKLLEEAKQQITAAVVEPDVEFNTTPEEAREFFGEMVEAPPVILQETGKTKKVRKPKKVEDTVEA